MPGMLNRRAAMAALSALAVPVMPTRAHGAAPPRNGSAGGALTEIGGARDARAERGGGDTTSLFPAAVRELPSVGYARTLSAEGVLSLRPTLVLHGADAGPPAVLAQLAAARLNLVRLDLDHQIEGLLAATRRIAALTDRGPQGARLVQSLSAQWDSARREVAARRGGTAAPRVLFVMSHSMAQVRIAGRETGADAMISLAGGHNAFGDVTGYKPLTPEAAIAAAPDLILVTEQGLQAAGGVDGLLKAPGLAATPAGRARRVLAMDALLLLGFGPRLPQAVTQLAGLLHGRA